MSSYVVNDSTIDKIVCYLSQRWWRQEWDGAGFTELGSIMRPSRIPEDHPGAWESELGRRMHLLNVGAVRQRYDDADESRMIPDVYEYAGRPAPSRVVAYKAIRCWSYQCCEGQGAASPLRAALRRIADQLAHEIVAELDEYNAADWG